MTTLFAPTRTTAMTLRDYQTEDADAIVASWNDGKRGVMCRHATGLGKSVMIAELCRRRTEGRVLVLVDVGSLAHDLHRTIIRHTGEVPGILTGGLKTHWPTSRIVVATVQSMYAGGDDPRYKKMDASEFSTVLIDEAESSIADRFSETVKHFTEGNPAIKVAGLTATPFRTDGKGMIEMFDHASNEAGPLNRDVLWSVTNGWLVKPRQGFVHCELDFSTLKLRRQEDGDKDYSDDDIASLMSQQDEQQWRKMAESIHAAAQGKPSIVMCPNSVEIAKIVAYHLCGAAGSKDAAQPVYGAQGDEADDLMKAYKKGDFPYIVAVKKLEKGFDHDEVRCLFMLRKTKSRRMYEQFLGRGARPLVGIRPALNDEPDAEKRKAIIAASAKPYFVLFDLVGVHPSAKDLGVIDILGAKILNEREREKVKKNQLEDGFCDEGELFKEPNDIGDDARKAREDVKAEIAAERRANEEEERKRRAALEIKATTLVQITDDWGIHAVRQRMQLNPKAISEKQMRLLVALGVDPKKAARFGKRQAGAVIQSCKERNVPVNWGRVNRWERGQ